MKSSIPDTETPNLAELLDSIRQSIKENDKILQGETIALLRSRYRELSGDEFERIQFLSMIKEVLEREVNRQNSIVDRFKRTTDELTNKSVGMYLKRLKVNGAEVPNKFSIRRIKDKAVRKTITPFLSQQRDDYVVDAIQKGNVTRKDGTVSLARSFGLGFDERVVEIPLAIQVAELDKHSAILDAGSALNLPYLKPFFDAGAAKIVHLTLTGDKEIAQFSGNKISYYFGDIRDLVFKDHIFDKVICVSTLEHIGMDNSRYGAACEHDPDSYVRAVQEMLRVLRPGGSLFLSFPVAGDRASTWFRFFSLGDIQKIASLLSGCKVDIDYFTYESGWRHAEEDQVFFRLHPKMDQSEVRSIATVYAVKN